MATIEEMALDSIKKEFLSAFINQRERNVKTLNFQVPLESDDGTLYHISATYTGDINADLVLVTHHGATYNKSYWDWPQQPDVYSFVKYITNRQLLNNVGCKRRRNNNIAVLSIDRLGAGRSDHPDSSLVTYDHHAYYLHLINTIVKGFCRKVVAIGESLGSSLSQFESTTYNDYDGLVLMGYVHELYVTIPQLISLFYPANNLPQYANLDSGYFTTIPGARPFLYNVPTANPGVIAYDDRTKDVVSLLDIQSHLAILLSPTDALQVKVPVFSLLGDVDKVFCSGPGCPEAAAEPSFWSPEAEFEFKLIPETGHSMNLHPSAHTSYAYIYHWLSKKF